MTTTYVIRKHYTTGWQLRWAVIPVRDGWPGQPLHLFNGRTAARHHLDHITRGEQK